MKIVNILGTEYTIEVHEFDKDDVLKNNSFAGYCCSDIPLIVIADMNDEVHFDFQNELEKENYRKLCLRHEIIHAFLNESGLKENANTPADAWSKNEEMVDWIAIQFPKIKKVYEELEIC